MKCFANEKNVQASTSERRVLCRLKAGKHQFSCDETEKFGGLDEAPDPWDYIMAGLVSCTLISIEETAHEAGIDLRTAKVEVHYRWDDQEGHLFCKKVSLPGELSSADRDKLIEAAHSPAHKMLVQGLQITNETLEIA